MFDPSKLLDWVKLPTKTLVALSIATAILLFSPVATLRTIGLDVFVGSYRPFIGALFIGALSLSAVSGLGALLTFINPWLVEAYWVRTGRKRLQRLNPEEKELLNHYIRNQTRSQRLPLQSGTVAALVHDKVIVRGSNVGNIYGFDYIIQPWAWEYLNENPHLLQ